MVSHGSPPPPSCLPQLAGPPPEQAIRINVPAKTQLYVDQTNREKQNAVQMHRTFQRDLYLLRLAAARAYAKTLSKSMAPVAATTAVSLKVDAEVIGIGPRFKLLVVLQNTSRQAVSGVTVAYTWDRDLYGLSQPMAQAPLLVPGVRYTVETWVEVRSCSVRWPLV